MKSRRNNVPNSLSLDRKRKELLVGFLEDLEKDQGENGLQIAIYGGLVTGFFVPKVSNVNLFILVVDSGKFLETACIFSRYADLNLQPVIYTPEDLRRG